MYEKFIGLLKGGSILSAAAAKGLGSLLGLALAVTTLGWVSPEAALAVDLDNSNNYTDKTPADPTMATVAVPQDNANNPLPSNNVANVTANIGSGAGNVSAMGGLASSGDSTGNTLNIHGAYAVYGQAAGGFAKNGSALNNRTSLNDATASVKENVFGGVSLAGSLAEGNVVDIAAGAVEKDVLGGLAVTGAAIGNKVFLSGGTVTGSVYGGRAGVDLAGTASSGHEASRNEVHVAAGNLKEVIGGAVRKTGGGALAVGNLVKIVGGAVSAVKGAEITDDGVAEGNMVFIDGTAITVNGEIYGANVGTGQANANRVTINAPTIIDNIFGGRVGGAGTVKNNEVVINGGTYSAADKTVYGGYAAGAGQAVGNRVVINDLKGNSTIFGGSNQKYSVIGGYADSGQADGNEVVINGGTFANSEIYGGSTNAGSAINNVVIISGSASLEAINLNGGGKTGGNGDIHSGNVLKANLYSGSKTLGDIKNFEFVDFLLPASVAPGGQVILSANRITNTDASKKTSVRELVFQYGGDLFEVNDSFELIALTDVTDTSFAGGGLEIVQGSLLSYDAVVSLDQNTVTAKIVGAPKVRPETKALSEGFVSGVTVLNQGTDLAADKGVSLAAINAMQPGLQSFGSFNGGSSRYSTGSHVDVDSFNLLTGLSYGTDFAAGRLTLGGFFEYGHGNYDTYNVFPNGVVAGDGDVDSIGGGALVRFDFSDAGPGHFYAEGSVRYGQAKTDFNSSSFAPQTGGVSFETKSDYYGLHAGTGYAFNLTDRSLLDVYGKYLWSRQEGDSIALRTGERIDFDDVDSHRARVGARYSFKASDLISPYFGAAAEQEFDGQASARVAGRLPIEAPNLKGATGIAEIGVDINTGGPMVLALGAQGYMGKRKGASGSLELKFEF
jgi:hypothetical protein